MIMRQLISLVLVFIFISCGDKEHDDSCNGNTRREVKLMIDAAAANVDTNAVVISLEDLGNLSVPEVKKETERQEVETKLYTVTATVDEVDRKHDGDYHIRLKEGDHYLICEIPNPGCEYAISSGKINDFIRTRNFVEGSDLEGKTVTITGVAFVDIDHHYKRKQAKNNIELHPVLDIHF